MTSDNVLLTRFFLPSLSIKRRDSFFPVHRSFKDSPVFLILQSAPGQTDEGEGTTACSEIPESFGGIGHA